MKDPECWHPETDNPYPLCVGEMINGEIKDKCKNCCVYTEYDVYNSPYPDKQLNQYRICLCEVKIMKQMTKKDTERIAKHLKIIGDIISNYEDKYSDVEFNPIVHCWYEDMVNVAGAVERVFNNSAQMVSLL